MEPGTAYSLRNASTGSTRSLARGAGDRRTGSGREQHGHTSRTSTDQEDARRRGTPRSTAPEPAAPQGRSRHRADHARRSAPKNQRKTVHVVAPSAMRTPNSRCAARPIREDAKDPTMRQCQRQAGERRDHDRAESMRRRSGRSRDPSAFFAAHTVSVLDRCARSCLADRCDAALDGTVGLQRPGRCRSTEYCASGTYIWTGRPGLVGSVPSPARRHRRSLAPRSFWNPGRAGPATRIADRIPPARCGERTPR